MTPRYRKSQVNSHFVPIRQKVYNRSKSCITRICFRFRWCVFIDCLLTKQQLNYRYTRATKYLPSTTTRVLLAYFVWKQPPSTTQQVSGVEINHYTLLHHCIERWLWHVGWSRTYSVIRIWSYYILWYYWYLFNFVFYHISCHSHHHHHHHHYSHRHPTNRHVQSSKIASTKNWPRHIVDSINKHYRLYIYIYI